jgi:hypothetical protein
LFGDDHLDDVIRRDKAAWIHAAHRKGACRVR